MNYQIIQHQHIFAAEQQEFKQCHASTICLLPDKSVIAAWFGGDKEKAPNVAIWSSKQVNGCWSVPRKIAVHEGIPCWNPVFLWLNDKLVLFYKQGNEISTWQTMFKESFDYGETWTESKELVPGDFGGRGPVKNKCLVLKSGTILAPASIEAEYWECFVDRSEDGGTTWEQSDYVPMDKEKLQDKGVIQPTMWEDESGRVHMLMRSTEGAIYRSFSDDEGKTWGKAERTKLPNNNCGIDVVKLEDGRLVLVYNPISGNWAARTPISFSVSDDNGESWSEPQNLDYVPCDIDVEWAEFSYPAILSRENDIFLTYTWKRQTIAFWQIRIF